MPINPKPPFSKNGNLVFRITSPPANEPITIQEIHNYGKFDTDADDVVFESQITAVRQVAEGWLGRALIEQEITATLDWWPGSILELPRPPLISVTSIKTIDEEDDKTLYLDSSFFVRTDIIPGQIVIKNGSTPPINTDRYYGGYEVIFKAGYGTNASDVPQALRTGLIEWTLFAIENRIVSREPPAEAFATLDHYRIRRV